MNRVQCYSLTLELIRQLRNEGSWCGETHIQKSMYFLEELLEVPTPHKFILYKHGPFSFDFRSHLNELRARNLIMYKHVPPYGPQMVLTEEGKKYLDAKKATIEEWESKISSIATCLGDKGVADLEKLATALMITRQEKLTDTEERASTLNEWKPHISIEEAKRAVYDYDQIASCLKEQICQVPQ